MSIRSMMYRAAGVALLILAAWLWLQGQPGLVVAIAGGAGVASFLAGGLSA